MLRWERKQTGAATTESQLGQRQLSPARSSAWNTPAGGEGGDGSAGGGGEGARAHPKGAASTSASLSSPSARPRRRPCRRATAAPSRPSDAPRGRGTTRRPAAPPASSYSGKRSGWSRPMRWPISHGGRLEVVALQHGSMIQVEGGGDEEEEGERHPAHVEVGQVAHERLVLAVVHLLHRHPDRLDVAVAAGVEGGVGGRELELLAARFRFFRLRLDHRAHLAADPESDRAHDGEHRPQEPKTTRSRGGRASPRPRRGTRPVEAGVERRVEVPAHPGFAENLIDALDHRRAVHRAARPSRLVPLESVLDVRGAPVRRRVGRCPSAVTSMMISMFGHCSARCS